MKKFNCTATPSSTTYFVEVIADDENHAIEIARVKAKEKWGSSVAKAKCELIMLIQDIRPLRG